MSICLSTKVPPEVSQRVLETGYATSDVMQAGLELFLNLPRQEQANMIWALIQRKKRERVMERYRSKLKITGSLD